MAKKKPIIADLSTEDKIMEAARKVFLRKGYSATRTRDIAIEAGINLALLNYYFRSKEKLFRMVMVEKMKKFFGVLMPVIYDEATTLEFKLQSISANYINLLLEHPDLPFFVLAEIRNDPALIANVAQKKDFLKHSVFIKQVSEKTAIDPYQFLFNLLGMCIFPFVMRPAFQKLTDTEDLKFRRMMKLIPKWAKAILKTK
jgi:AcrR family transcriptional regulator